MAGHLARLMISQSLHRAILCKAVRPVLSRSARSITTEKKKEAADSSVMPYPPDWHASRVGAPVDTNWAQRKDWISRGLNFDDEDLDRWSYGLHAFCFISLVTLGFCFFLTYKPNITWPNRDWVTREAFLELHRREKFGLPLIDPDLVPRDRMILPSDEELGDFEIII